MLIETSESVKINKLRKTNELLTETINSRNKDSYVKIKEVDGINEMQRKILQINDDSTIKTSIITQQFLDATQRKRKPTNVDNLIRHVAGENPENQAGLARNILTKRALNLLHKSHNNQSS